PEFNLLLSCDELPESCPLLYNLKQGAFLDNLNSELGTRIIALSDIESIQDLSESIHDRISSYVQDVHASNLDAPLNVLALGISCLNGFLQTSWTGPRLSSSMLEHLDQIEGKLSRKSILNFLSEDDEEAYSLTPSPLLLAIARMILLDDAVVLTGLKTVEWWKSRCCFIQQRILANPTQTLLDMMLHFIKQARAKLPPLTDETKDLYVKLHLEEGLIHSYHRQDVKAFQSFSLASEASKLKWSMSGALGKRTKFQTFDVAQLLVVAESAPTSNGHLEPKEHNEDATSNNLPKALLLNDDTLLEKIDFTKLDDKVVGKDVSRQGCLKIVDQCILLAMCLNVKNTNPSHGLTEEEMVPYVTRVLENPNNWMVHTIGLLLRSRLESQKSRTVERSVLQIQALVDQIPLPDPLPSERLSNFFHLLAPPRWELEKELAERLVSLGVMKSALEIFQRLELWEDAISCMRSLGQAKQAEDLVKARLHITPASPLLLCILGDIRKDPSYYQQAWEVSDYRFARAMRSLGAHHFSRKAWRESVECYHRALAINPLFENSWFVMGCAAMRIDEWDTAAKAFHRCVSINFENGEAWTNLASVYVKQGRKRDAWRAQKEALKQSFESYRMWENLLVFSVDLGEFAEAMEALRQIVELRWKKGTGSGIPSQSEGQIVDIEVLSILVNAIINNTPDANGVPASKLSVRMSALLDHITSKIVSSSSVYTIASNFYQYQHQISKCIDYKTKAYRVGLNHPQLTLDVSVFENAAKCGLDLVGALEKHCDAKEENGELIVKDWRYQSRMTLRTLIGRTKDTFESNEWHGRMRNRLESFKS
ncbi:hypothetical protein SeMB42_g03828, partial [Synchytrium endobioticum]